MAIVDIHGHLNSPPELMAFKSGLLSSRIHRGRSVLKLSDERMKPIVDNHIKKLDEVGTDIQFLSPRPFQLMHSDPLFSIVEDFCKANNDAIKQSIDYYPDRYRGVCGLPQVWGQPVNIVFDEMERCVKDMGFVGIMIDPDPSEGLDPNMPPMGDEYWYPLYEKMVELDVPGLIHGGPFRFSREPELGYFVGEEAVAAWAILRTPRIFEDFPALKLVIGHGGGYVPYQAGRARAFRLNAMRNDPSLESFDDSMRRLYYDTVLYDPHSLELLFRVVGPDRCLFGTDKPANGSVLDPETGRAMNDIKPMIDAIPWLGDEERAAIYEGNARKAYSLLPPAGH